MDRSDRTHRRTHRGASVLAFALALLATGCGGSEQGEPEPSDAAAPARDASGFVAVGEQAPDFALRGATRYGVLAEPVQLSDFQGKTVVLAFFFRARGRG